MLTIYVIKVYQIENCHVLAKFKTNRIAHEEEKMLLLLETDLKVVGELLFGSGTLLLDVK